MTGTVVDAETGQPIEGAVVLVEWTKTRGIGLTYTKSDKVIEVLSDKEGKFRVSAIVSPLADEPHLAIYKKGYVTWSSEFIFPNTERRTGFQWQSGNIYKLEIFKDTYSYIEHQAFTERAIRSTLSSQKKRLFMKMYYEAEEKKIIQERSEWDERKRRGFINEKNIIDFNLLSNVMSCNCCIRF